MKIKNAYIHTEIYVFEFKINILHTSMNYTLSKLQEITRQIGKKQDHLFSGIKNSKTQNQYLVLIYFNGGDGYVCANYRDRSG